MSSFLKRWYTESLTECIVACQGSVNSLPARVMLDSGCSTVGVDESFVSPDQYTGEI